MGLIGSWTILFVSLLTANRQVGEVFLQFLKLTFGDPALDRIANSKPWIGIPLLIGITWGTFYLPLLIAGLVCAEMARRLSSIVSDRPVASDGGESPAVTSLALQDADVAPGVGLGAPPARPGSAEGNHTNEERDR